MSDPVIESLVGPSEMERLYSCEKNLSKRVQELTAENEKLRMDYAEAWALVLNHEGRIERLTETLRAWQKVDASIYGSPDWAEAVIKARQLTNEMLQLREVVK